eukprot:3325236-Amphidinium_carterae.1
MALNQLQFVMDFDYVVYIANGKIEVQGPCAEAFSSSALASYVEKGGGMAAGPEEGCPVVVPPVPTA